MKIRRCKNEKIFIVVNFVWLSCDKIPPRLPSFSVLIDCDTQEPAF